MAAIDPSTTLDPLAHLAADPNFFDENDPDTWAFVHTPDASGTCTVCGYPDADPDDVWVARTTPEN